MRPPAVVLSGHLMALGVVRSLGHHGVGSIVLHYRPETDVAHESRYVIRSHRVAHPEREPEQFLGALRALGPRLQGSPLIAASDETLALVARHRAELARWYRVLAADDAIVDQIVRKERTYALADAIGVRAPATHLVTSPADLEREVGAFGFPCLIKPSQSHRYVEIFKRKMVRVNDLGEAREAYREAAGAGLDVLLQELIPGDDEQGVNYNSYRRAGDQIEFTAQKVRLTPRSFGPPSVVMSRWIPEVIGPGRAILDALGYEGYSCVEFKRDARDGSYVLMEINGRFNLSSLLSERCGINFPWIAYRDRVMDERTQPRRQADGIYWIDGTKDVVYAAPDLLRGRLSLRRLITPYLRPRVFAVLDLRDARPFARRAALLVDQAVDLLRRKLSLTRDEAHR